MTLVKQYTIKNKKGLFFILIVGGAILFYEQFLDSQLLRIVNQNIYAQDLAAILLFIYIIFRMALLKQGKTIFNLKSTKYFILFLLWGILAIIRGYQEYGFSSIGESRSYLIILIYYFYILMLCKEYKNVNYIINGLFLFIMIMLVSKFIHFFFLGGNVDQGGRWAYRFIFGVNTLLVSFLWIYIFQMYLDGKRKYLKFIPLVILSLVLIIIQIRSVWVSTIGGIFSLFVLKKKISIKAAFFISSIILLLLLLLPVISEFIGVDTSYQLEKSLTFVINPKYDHTGSWRLIGWQAELVKALRNPILGQGFGEYSVWYDGDKWVQTAVHNGYIMLFSRVGAIGILLLFAGLYYWFKEMHGYIKNGKNGKYILSGSFFHSALIMHLIYIMFYGFTIYFWIIIGMGTVLCRYNKNIVSTKNKLVSK